MNKEIRTFPLTGKSLLNLAMIASQGHSIIQWLMKGNPVELQSLYHYCKQVDELVEGVGTIDDHQDPGELMGEICDFLLEQEWTEDNYLIGPGPKDGADGSQDNPAGGKKD